MQLFITLDISPATIMVDVMLVYTEDQSWYVLPVLRIPKQPKVLGKTIRVAEDNSHNFVLKMRTITVPLLHPCLHVTVQP